ncbi:MAG: hypothetical protein INR71_07690, partial [Terriglobus roseus]|nr:hypothetical protein [Terriglobus roseus]
EHLKKAKELNQPLNLSTLKSDIMRDFGASMQKLKHELGAEIEDLIHKRNEITNEIADLIQMKDRGNQEYEDLSHRNQQLTQLNNELVQSIQKMYEAGSDKARPPRPQLGSNGLTIGAPLMETRSASSGVTSPNGLGIYNHQSANSISLDPSRSNSQDPSLQTLVNEDAESAVMSSPHVINIRKGRPNMWKKGSQAVAKNIRGIKGAFASTNQYQGPYGTPGMPGTLTEGVPYGSMQEGMRPNNNDMGISGPMNVRKGDPNQYPFWAQDKGKKMNKLAAPMGMPNGSSTNLTGENGKALHTLDDKTKANKKPGLFGTDLSQRCQFEKRDIPSVVLSCIQEVELRGMDVEGVYRKSGGSGQVNAVRAGFERDANHDVSDPDLDIHAVTSCLKQYFRRLPVPLITFDVYDGLLEAASAPDHEQKMQGMRACMEALPKAHRDVLSFLVFHLARVMAREPQNLVRAFLTTRLPSAACADCETDVQPQPRGRVRADHHAAAGDRARDDRHAGAAHGGAEPVGEQPDHLRRRVRPAGGGAHVIGSALLLISAISCLFVPLPAHVRMALGRVCIIVVCLGAPSSTCSRRRWPGESLDRGERCLIYCF